MGHPPAERQGPEGRDVQPRSAAMVAPDASDAAFPVGDSGESGGWYAFATILQAPDRDSDWPAP